MKTTNGVLTSDVVASARAGLRDDWEWRHEVVSDVIVRLADELAATKAQNARLVALLQRSNDYQACDYCDGIETGEEASPECMNETDVPPCWMHQVIALLAEIGRA